VDRACIAPSKTSEVSERMNVRFGVKIHPEPGAVVLDAAQIRLRISPEKGSENVAHCAIGLRKYARSDSFARWRHIRYLFVLFTCAPAMLGAGIVVGDVCVRVHLCVCLSARNLENYSSETDVTWQELRPTMNARSDWTLMTFELDL